MLRFRYVRCIFSLTDDLPYFTNSSSNRKHYEWRGVSGVYSISAFYLTLTQVNRKIDLHEECEWTWPKIERTVSSFTVFFKLSPLHQLSFTEVSGRKIVYSCWRREYENRWLISAMRFVGHSFLGFQMTDIVCPVRFDFAQSMHMTNWLLIVLLVSSQCLNWIMIITSVLLVVVDNIGFQSCLVFAN